MFRFYTILFFFVMIQDDSVKQLPYSSQKLSPVDIIYLLEKNDSPVSGAMKGLDNEKSINDLR